MPQNSPKITCSIQYSKRMYKMNGNKNPNNSHNYYDEIDLYQGISKRNTYIMTLDTKTSHTPKQSYRMWWGAADQYTMSHGTYSHIMIQRILAIEQLKYTFETKQERITVSYHYVIHQSIHNSIASLDFVIISMISCYEQNLAIPNWSNVI